MRVRILSAVLVLGFAQWQLASASPLHDAAKRLDGVWLGDGYALRIDSQRDQARIDPKRPFQWQRFLVQEVRPDEIVFTIGPQLYEARLNADQLVLTGSSFRGEHKLRRQAEPPELGVEMRGTLSPASPASLSDLR